MDFKYSYRSSGENWFKDLFVGMFAFGLGLGAIAAIFVPFVVHVVVCVKANWAAMLIIGLVLPPVGWIHGVGIILGVWG